MPHKLYCEVVQIVDHGERVYSVFLKPESKTPRFRPGQFLHLALDVYKPGDFWPESRVFSIASTPVERDFLLITYAVKGKFTTRMEAELRVGGKVWIKMPYGEFTINTDGPICLLAGGTGVTAFTAFLSSLSMEYPHSIHLFYGARRSDLLTYRSLVNESVNKCPNLHPYFFIEQGADIDCISGRINLDQIWQLHPNPQEVVYYLSGPPIMLKSLSSALVERGIPTAHILTDAWE